MPATENESARKGWVFPRGLLVLTAAVAACLGSFFWYFEFYPQYKHVRARRQFEVAILKLATKRPEGVSEDQWASCVYWTWNLHGNWGFYPSFDTERLLRFADELDEKLDGPVDISTVDWIWDEYVRRNPNAEPYSDPYRPTTPERLQQVDSEGWTGKSLDSYIHEYNRRCQENKSGD